MDHGSFTKVSADLQSDRGASCKAVAYKVLKKKTGWLLFTASSKHYSLRLLTDYIFAHVNSQLVKYIRKYWYHVGLGCTGSVSVANLRSQDLYFRSNLVVYLRKMQRL